MPDAPPPPPAAAPIEDYALIGDCTTAALVSRAGSIDWLCWPRFDSAACFAALLGTTEHGRWLLAPEAQPARTERRYRGATMILETVFTTEGGEAALIDFMPANAGHSSIVRIVEGRSGRVAFKSELLLRFDYGAAIPWVTRLSGGQAIRAIAGPDMVVLRADVPLVGRGFTTASAFTVGEGERVRFTLTYAPSHEDLPFALDVAASLDATERFWRGWAERCTYKGEWPDQVLRSLLTLKALTFRTTGGMVAAPTTSLPEQLGGARNWDYRFCWLRDATITLFAMLHCGYLDEAAAWRDWLHRSIAGTPDQLQPLYGISGERRIDEWEARWLPGYQGAAPVRIGNAARGQVQLDTYGELMNALYLSTKSGLDHTRETWSMQVVLLHQLERIWDEPDRGIWEIRGEPCHFTFSKVMAWVAFDRAIRTCEESGLEGPVDAWRALRDRIHASVTTHGFDPHKNAFVQRYGDTALDASLLLLPLVGFLPADDPRILGTVDAIERGLMQDGLVQRYETSSGVDGLKGSEGVFMACSFWLADNYALQGRMDDARALFERLLDVCNDVGLLAEEYDPGEKRQCGNFPQAFSHVALVGTALNLARAGERWGDAGGGVLNDPGHRPQDRSGGQK